MDPEHPPFQRRSPLPIIPTVIGGLLLLSLLATLIVSAGPWQPAFSRVRATVTPAQQIIYQDSLKHLTSKYGWTINDACPFTSEGLHITAAVACFAPVGILTDGTITVTVRQVEGETTRWKSIIFRHQGVGSFYAFEIDGAGNWIVTKTTDGALSGLSQQANPALRTGASVSNTLTVQMMGSHFTFAANGTTLGSVDDATFVIGAVGLGGDDQADMLFTDVTIFSPPD
jgi:hypothetical protein